MTGFEQGYQAWKRKRSGQFPTVGENDFQGRYTQWQVRTGRVNLEQLGQQVTSRVNSWLQNQNSFLGSYNARFGSRKGDLTDSYVADSQAWLEQAQKQAQGFAAEAKEIKGILSQYGSFFDKNWIAGITKALDGAMAQNGQVIDYGKQDVRYWSQFENAEGYKKAQIYDEKSKADLSQLSINLDTLRKQIAQAEELEWQMYGYFGKPSTDTKAMAKGKALQAQLKALTGEYGSIEGMRKALKSKEEYYDSAKGIQLEAEQRKADLPKLSGELEKFRKQLEAAEQIQKAIHSHNPPAENKKLQEKLAKMTKAWGGLEGMQAAFSEKEQYYNTAKRYQDWEKLGDVVNNADFKTKSGYKSTEIAREEWLKRAFSQYGMGYEDLVHEFINGDPETRKKIWLAYSSDKGLAADIDRFDVYNRMSEKEIATYNYHYNKSGKEAAEEYLKSITETVGHRAAQARFEKLEGKPLAEILYGVKAGAEQFKSGMKGAWNAVTGKDSYTPASTTQILGGMAREDLKSNALGQMAYDILSTTTNMLPSIAVSAGVGLVSKTAGAAVGAGLLGGGPAGNAYTEMINQGYGKTQAGNYAKLVGLSEAGLSYLLGGIGKLGGKVSGNVIGKIVDKVDDVFSKVAVKLGGTAISEGMEEGLQEILTPWFKRVATGIQEDVNWEEAAYSSLLGAITGLLFEGKGAVTEARADVNRAKGATTQVEKPAQLTQNEQLVVNQIFQSRVAAEEKTGQKLSKAEKAEIYNRVVEDMDKGYLTTGEIEAAFRGDTEYDRLSKEKEEFDQLYKTESGKLTEEQKDRLAELKAKNQQTSYEKAVAAAQKQHSQSVAEMVKTSRLAESYREQGRKSEAFKVEDLSRYSEKQQKVMQSAIDSGILNNTNRTHEFVDFIAKVSEKLGVDFSFTDNKRLKESGFAMDGVTVNGFVNEKGVTVNVNSAKALNSVVGHEITHVLEGTDLYESLKKAVETWGNAKGIYETRLKELTKLYEGKEGYTGENAAGKIEREVVADLVGDYLFTDKAFVESLSREHRNVFQKIFDEIKYLCKVATAGSQEARQLEKVKKIFQDVYREASENGVKNPTAEGGDKYSLNQNAKTELHKALYDKSYQGEVLLRDESPPIMLAQKGVKNLPMSMNASHIRENVFTEEEAQKMGLRVAEGINYHGLGEEFFLQIIDGLDNVKEAYRGTKNADNAARRENYFLLVSEFVDKDGNVINVPVYINEHALFNRVFIDVNKVSTVYGKTNFRDYINRQIRLNNLVRIKNRSNQTSESNAPIARDYGKDAPANSIRSEDGNVNNKNSLSAQGQAETGGQGWQVLGRDVALEQEGPGLPMPPGYQKGNRVAGATQKGSKASQTAREVGLPLPPGYQEGSKPAQTAREIGLPLPPGYRSAEALAPNSNGKDKQRKWVKTSTESNAVSRAVLLEDLDQSKITYTPISNKETLGKANAKLYSMGYDSAVSYFNNQIYNDKVRLDDIAMGERLIQEAVKRGDTKTAGELIQNVAILGTELGQKVQALSIIKRLTPEGQLGMLQNIVNRGKAKGDVTFDGVEITQEMIDYILSTYNKDGTYDQKKLNKAVEDVKQKIADQMTVTKGEKVNAWRYLSMLGNPKTHIRNVVSNIANMGTIAVKDVIARTAEEVFSVENRTKTWKKASDLVKTYARDTATEMKNEITGEGKYSDTADIKAKRQIFQNSILQKVYDFNSDMLSKEDWWFSKVAFQNSLQEFLAANGIETTEDIHNNPEIVEKGKRYALERAEIATFRQYSWLASKISSIERKNTAFGVAVGAVIPFKKTPVNVAKAGLSYSPLGFAKTLTYDVAQVKKGNMDASTLVDHLAQNLTGTGLALTGYLLAAVGFLNGAGEDDKEGTYDYHLGEQAYSVNVGENTYSLSWLSPTAMPLFVGANLYEQLVEGKEWNADVLLETLAQTLDPLSEMSFLSSLDDVLSSYDSGVEKFAGIGMSALTSYASQFVPTVLSQTAATVDDTKRTTKVAANSGSKVIDDVVHQLQYKIPVLRQLLQPSTDIWGNEIKQSENFVVRAIENYVAPWSRKTDISSEVDDEIKSLYSMVGEDSLLPGIPKSTVTYNGTKYPMSAQEYTTFKKTYGQTAYSTLEKLFQTETYRNADPTVKVEMIRDAYTYASDTAKREYLGKRDVEYTNATKDGIPYYKENTIIGAIKYDVSVEEYELFSTKPGKYALAQAVGGYERYKTYQEELEKLESDKDTAGKTVADSRKKKVIEYINNLDAEYGEKIILYISEYDSEESRDAYGYKIVDYLNSRTDISYSEMEAILLELGFQVDENGRITW